jgi:hypothetical protein
MVYFNTTARWFRKMAGLFRIVFCGLSMVASGLMMLSWAHIYHASQRFTTSMSPGVKVAIGSFYILSGIEIVGVCIAYPIIAQYSREKLDYLYAGALFASVGWLAMAGGGFMIYAIMIYYQMRKVENINPLKLKVMRIMMVIDVLFFICLVWLTVLAVDYAVNGKF